MNDYLDQINVNGVLYTISGGAGGSGVTSGEVETMLEDYTYDKNTIDDKIASGGGITSGDVQIMIDQSISGKQDTLSAGTNIDIFDWLNNGIVSVNMASGFSADDTNVLPNNIITNELTISKGGCSTECERKFPSYGDKVSFDKGAVYLRVTNGGVFDSSFEPTVKMIMYIDGVGETAEKSFTLDADVYNPNVNYIRQALFPDYLDVEADVIGSVEGQWMLTFKSLDPEKYRIIYCESYWFNHDEWEFDSNIYPIVYKSGFGFNSNMFDSGMSKSVIESIEREIAFVNAKMPKQIKAGRNTEIDFANRINVVGNSAVTSA